MVITDNDTNSGRIHPSQALRAFKNKMGKPKSKLIVNATSVSSFSIADPNDSCMLDIVGFSTDTPQVMKAFALT
jgi:60 kDa SS-A/Ro ribonucleoprotein